jgi:tRNA U34 2-thiouridine synthase MnmA/TrmU
MVETTDDTSKTSPVRALGLCSGGLDSILSALVLKDQGIEVSWIHLETPFFGAENAREAARRTGIPLRVMNITTRYMKMLRNPSVGYGRHMNPCMDCHALMFRIAGEVMEEEGFSFLFSGEVLGQRPMSQTQSSLRYVEKNSGYDGYILRPLSARRLPETIPERQGLVDRERLHGFSGRSRKPQAALAKEFGVNVYPAPAGGCLLTDKGFSQRLSDLLNHEEAEQITENDLHLLKYGRHFRLKQGGKLVVGRTKGDNKRLADLADPARDIILKTRGRPGPTAILPKGGPPEIVTLAASIAAGYAKAPVDEIVSVAVTSPAGESTVSVIPLPPKEVRRLMIEPGQK